MDLLWSWVMVVELRACVMFSLLLQHTGSLLVYTHTWCALSGYICKSIFDKNSGPMYIYYYVCNNHGWYCISILRYPCPRSWLVYCRQNRPSVFPGRAIAYGCGVIRVVFMICRLKALSHSINRHLCGSAAAIRKQLIMHRPMSLSENKHTNDFILGQQVLSKPKC